MGKKSLQREGRDQFPVSDVSILKVMSSAAFGLGVADVRAGRPHRPDYDCWPDADDQWNYERGRAWALLAPRNCTLKRNGKVTNEALKWAAVHDEHIL